MKPEEVIKNAGINALEASLGDFIKNIAKQATKTTEPVEMALNVKIAVLNKGAIWEVSAKSDFTEKYKHEQLLDTVSFDENQPDLYEDN